MPAAAPAVAKALRGQEIDTVTGLGGSTGGIPGIVVQRRDETYRLPSSARLPPPTCFHRPAFVGWPPSAGWALTFPDVAWESSLTVAANDHPHQLAAAANDHVVQSRGWGFIVELDGLDQDEAAKAMQGLPHHAWRLRAPGHRQRSGVDGGQY